MLERITKMKYGVILFLQMYITNYWLDHGFMIGGYFMMVSLNGKKIILAPLKPVLDPKPSKGEGKALIIHGECQ